MTAKEQLKDFYAAVGEKLRKQRWEEAQRIKKERVAAEYGKLSMKERVRLKAISIPIYPSEKLIIAKDGLGDVLITEHAWQRFVKRYSCVAEIRTPGWFLPEYFVRKMKEVFERSYKTKFDNVTEALHMINNNFVEYFLDPILRLRFVIRRYQKISVMVTVEIVWKR